MTCVMMTLSFKSKIEVDSVSLSGETWLEMRQSVNIPRVCIAGALKLRQD
ncbi:hypothetical protein [uncultured Shewanella sp.]|nr:hypothetical protein [uncultured Shewanella sp.]